MRLKKDSASWHASGLIVRDKRNDKDTPEVAKPRAKKDRKTWCGGKEGRQHRGKWCKEGDDLIKGRVHFWGEGGRVLVCERCKRQLDSCRSWFGTKCRAKNHGHAVPAETKP